MSAADSASTAGVLGIELGSTRIKLCLVAADDPATILATGAHEWQNQFVDGVWTYALDDVWSGLQSAYADLVAKLGSAPVSFAGVGISAMMHGYLAFDGAGELLVPFRTWRNTSTGDAAAELTELLGVNIPLRWSIAHLQQAVRDAEPHVPEIRSLNTLAGYVHEKLTGRHVLGVGDASGMFPIDPATGDYDDELVDRYDRLVADTALIGSLRDLLPEVLVAGQPAGTLTAAGAALLDPSGALQPGAPLCPPEGDAGTGMVATDAIAPRTGNISAGTSIFAMVVMERPLQRVHHEIDVVTTPTGAPVAMVHCNNGTSELAEWAAMFGRFAEAAGTPLDGDAVYSALFAEAMAGEADAGGLLAYNLLAGEPIAGLDEGRPLVVRGPESRLTLANFMRAQLYGVFGTLSIGMQVLAEEGVELDTMSAHGGMFRTAGVAQRLLAGALNAPVTVAGTASEGGAWGMAVLAAFAAQADGTDSSPDLASAGLSDYLRERVFAGAAADTVHPDPQDVAGFATYLTRYRAGLEVERAAVAAL
jgi:sugar (pentulose or hexulose) kinase